MGNWIFWSFGFVDCFVGKVFYETSLMTACTKTATATAATAPSFMTAPLTAALCCSSMSVGKARESEKSRTQERRIMSAVEKRLSQKNNTLQQQSSLHT